MKSTLFGKSTDRVASELASLATAAHVLILSGGASLAADVSTKPLEPGNGPNLAQSVFPRATTNAPVLTALPEEPVFPLEAKLGLKHPLRSGVYGTGDFTRIETALTSQFGGFLQATATDAALGAYRREVREKSDWVKVKTKILFFIPHTKTVYNWGKYQALDQAKRKQQEVGTNLVTLRSLTLSDVKFEDITAVQPVRTLVNVNADRFISIYQVSTRTLGTRYAMIAETIPAEQRELRRVLLEDPMFLTRRPFDFAGFSTRGHSDLARALALSISALDAKQAVAEIVLPGPGVPDESFRSYLRRDMDVLAEARREGAAAGAKSGKAQKFKVKAPKDDYVGLKYRNEGGQSSLSLEYRSGTVGFELGGNLSKLYASPTVVTPNGISVPLLKVPLYQAPPRSAPPVLRLEPQNAQLPSTESGRPKGKILDSSSPVQSRDGYTFDESRDRLMAARWKLDPDVNAALERRGLKMQRTLDGDNRVTFDEYSIIIDKAPSGNPPEALLGMLLADPNTFVNRVAFDELSLFRPERVSGAPKVGDLFQIDILGPQNGTVMLVERGKQHFTFQVVSRPGDLGHPENGAREFGFENLPDGSIRFYTRGASSASWLPVYIVGGIPQQMAWKSMLDGIREKVEFFGGKVREESPKPRIEEMIPRPIDPPKRIELGPLRGL